MELVSAGLTVCWPLEVSGTASIFDLPPLLEALFVVLEVLVVLEAPLIRTVPFSWAPSSITMLAASRLPFTTAVL